MLKHNALGLESCFGKMTISGNAISSDNRNGDRVTVDQSKGRGPHHKEAVDNSGPFNGIFQCIPCKLTWVVMYDTWPVILKPSPCQRCKKKIRPEMHLTPYQGKGRRYGGYHCKNCNNTWSSAGSWADSYQQCRNCKKYVYPKTQDMLRRSGEDNTGSGKPHQQELCGKCQELGHSCISVAVRADDDDDAGSNAYTTHVDDDDNDHDDYDPWEYYDEQQDAYNDYIEQCLNDYDDQCRDNYYNQCPDDYDEYLYQDYDYDD